MPQIQAADNLLKRLTRQFRQAVLNRLERDRPRYEQRIFNDMDRLHDVIRKGDAVLVEGRSEMARIIKLFSSSHWSHVALYVGDALIAPGRADGHVWRKRFGDQAAHLIIEAFSGQGVIVAPLEKYRNDNIRLCRPYGIAQPDLDRVVETVIGHVGVHYDDQNIVDIALMVLRSALGPLNKHAIKACLGNCNDFQVICSGMIAKAFQQVGYPIVPALATPSQNPTSDGGNPYGARLIMRHYSQIMPRDFDLSPNFEVIKFNIVGRPFDYQHLWHDRRRR